MTPCSFEICVPSWNSLPYLKILLDGINKNSVFRHTVTVHDNGSTDGTGEWLKTNNINHTKTPTNLGFCGVNVALRNVQADHVMIFNSDMYPLPGWDLETHKQINLFKRYDISNYTISSCLVEPTGANPEYEIRNFGTDCDAFDRENLVKDFFDNRSFYLSRKDTVQYSHPILLPTKMLQEIGFMDEEYFPGWASDHDLAARAYFRAGCRNFVMLGKSKVYHFSSKTFQQLPDEIRRRDGQDIFQKKWNMSVDHFRSLIGIRNEFRIHV